MLAGYAVDLLVHDLHQSADVALGEYVGTNPTYDHLLEAAGVEPGSLAGILSALHDRLADVVGELAALGVLAAERPVAGLALDQPAEQIGACDSPWVGDPGRAGAHQTVDPAEAGLGDDGGERLFNAYRLGAVLGPSAPDQCARVDLVTEDEVDASLGPESSRGTGDTLVVEGLGDGQHPLSGLGHLEHALDDTGRVLVGFQRGAFLGPILHHDPVVAVRRPAGDPEAARGGLPHSSGDLLGEIFAVELVHALYDGLQELSRRGVVGVLGDGDYPDAPAPEHGLEGDGVLALSGEAGELPDQNLPERSVGRSGLVDHLAELRPVGDASTLGLVDVLAGDDVVVLPGEVPESSQLCGNGKVHVLPVAGHPGVERRRRGGLPLAHPSASMCLSCPGSGRPSSSRPSGASSDADSCRLMWARTATSARMRNPLRTVSRCLGV